MTARADGRMNWEARYAGEGGYLFGRAPSGFLTENPWALSSGATALAVADGEGRNGVYLAERGLAVTSFDLSETAVARARALADGRGVQIDAHLSTWEDWDWSRSFDLVVAIFVQFVPPAERPGFFSRLGEAVAPGGRLLLHGYTPEQVAYGTGGPPDPAQMYTLPMLAEAFRGWRVLRLAAYEREVDEGRGHSGRSALIDFVAEKPA